MRDEPSRIVGALTAAITATIGVLIVAGWVSREVGGALTIAVGAWVYAAAEIVRSRVTPNDRVATTVPDPKSAPLPPPAGG
jgi:hypothetical protein